MTLLSWQNDKKSRFFKGSVITLFDFAFEFIVRLGSSLILTRLLFPEAYGLMGIVYSVIMGVGLLSDVGIKNAIIQRKSEELTSELINTAWTLQVIRGVLISIIVLVVAYPISVFYNMEALFPVIAVYGFSEAVKGFHSVSIYVKERELELIRATYLKMATVLVGIIVTIAYASIYHSVWALVVGGYANAIIYTLLSHLLMDGGFKHRFELHRSTVLKVLSFGKWLLLSGILGFVVNQGDKLIIAKLFDIEFLGLFTLAATLALIPRTILFTLFGKVLYPLYAEANREEGRQVFRKTMVSRTAICLVTLPLTFVFIGTGDWLISTLYDPRYQGAGRLLQLLSVGIALEICLNAGPIFIALNKPKIFTLLVAIKAVTLILSMLGAFYLFGIDYVIYGLILSPVGFYLVQSYFLRKEGLWAWKLELSLLTLLISYCYFIYYFRYG